MDRALEIVSDHSELPDESVTGTGSAGDVLNLIRRAGGLSRADIIAKTRLSRSTVAARLDTLQAAGWISSGQTTSARGRPPSHFHFRADQGALLIADAGATGVRVAMTDLRGHVLNEAREALDITIGPEQWLRSVDDLFAELLREGGPRLGFRPRHRYRATRPGRLRQRDRGESTHHDRMGRLPDPLLVHREVRLPGPRRQRRQRDDAR